MRFGDDMHADPCRGCRGVYRRSDMTPARKVLLRDNARGYYCSTCSTRYSRPIGL